jgi:hypothetical protein
MKRLTPCLILLVTVACGGSSASAPTPAPTPAARAVVGVLIDPNPVVAVASGDPDAPWIFRVNLQVSDSGGVGFAVTSVRTTLTSALSGLSVVTDGTNPFAGLSIPAYGERTKQLVAGYAMEQGTRECTVRFQLQFRDDLGNTSSYDGSVKVVFRGVVRADPVH